MGSMGGPAPARPRPAPVRIARPARQVQLFQLIALKDFLQKISALLTAKITESFRTSKPRRRRLGKKWSGSSLKRAVRISQIAATFHPAPTLYCRLRRKL